LQLIKLSQHRPRLATIEQQSEKLEDHRVILLVIKQVAVPLLKGNLIKGPQRVWKQSDSVYTLFVLLMFAIAWGQVTLSEAFSYAKTTYDKSFQAFRLDFSISIT
jgi:hypothetical protein